MKKISVIIPTLNEEAHIATTLQLTALPDVERIVVDGGSSDHTVEIAQNLGARVIQAPLGRARQMNLGAAQAQAKTLLFLHADTLPPAHFPSIIKVTLKQPKTSAGAFAFKLNEANIRLHTVEFFTNLRAGLFQLPRGNQGLFIRKHLFEELGGFPESPIMEDYLFARQLRHYGHIRITVVAAITSARRWKALGVFKTNWIDRLTRAGLLLHIATDKLAKFYYQPKPDAKRAKNHHHRAHNQ